jgi:hypothetical protein
MTLKALWSAEPHHVPGPARSARPRSRWSAARPGNRAIRLGWNMALYGERDPGRQ